MADADLNRQLRDAREELLGAIEIPELGGVRARANGFRRRRRMVAATLAVGAVLGTGTALWPDPAAGPVPAASTPAPSPEGWRSGDFAVLALDATVVDLPGDLYDVQFASPTTGYALARQCEQATCVVSFAVTADGGHTLRSGPALPGDQFSPQQLPHLHPLGTTGVALTAGNETYLAREWTGELLPWEATTGRAGDATDTVGAGPLYVPANTENCTEAPVRAWSASGALLRLRTQPELQVCRVAPARAGDGAWWVSGRADGQPAVAVSRDGGRSWAVTALPAGSAGAWAEIATRGPEVYASVVSPAAAGKVRVEAVYRAAGNGAFAPYARDLGDVAGDVVPLFDGRLVAANGQLLVSQGRDTALAPAGNGLPSVGSIERSAGAWIAYDVFANHWVAISTDGLTWQKINLH